MSRRSPGIALLWALLLVLSPLANVTAGLPTDPGGQATEPTDALSLVAEAYGDTHVPDEYVEQFLWLQNPVLDPGFTLDGAPWALDGDASVGEGAATLGPDASLGQTFPNGVDDPAQTVPVTFRGTDRVLLDVSSQDAWNLTVEVTFRDAPGNELRLVWTPQGTGTTDARLSLAAEDANPEESRVPGPAGTHPCWEGDDGIQACPLASLEVRNQGETTVTVDDVLLDGVTYEVPTAASPGIHLDTRQGEPLAGHPTDHVLADTVDERAGPLDLYAHDAYSVIVAPVEHHPADGVPGTFRGTWTFWVGLVEHTPSGPELRSLEPGNHTLFIAQEAFQADSTLDIADANITWVGFGSDDKNQAPLREAGSFGNVLAELYEDMGLDVDGTEGMVLQHPTLSITQSTRVGAIVEVPDTPYGYDASAYTRTVSGEASDGFHVGGFYNDKKLFAPLDPQNDQLDIVPSPITLDVQPPTIQDDAPTDLGTGEAVTFAANVTDNTKVDRVDLQVRFEHYDGTITWENRTFDGSVTSSLYSADVQVPDTAMEVDHTWTAQDAPGNIETLDATLLQVADTITPSLSATVEPVTTGGVFSVGANASDNREVQNVTASYTFQLADGSITSGTTDLPEASSGSYGYEADLTAPVDAVDLDLVVVANDGVNEVNKSFSENVQDTVPPEIHALTLQPGTPSTGDDLTFTVNATDNVGIDDVLLEHEFTFADGTTSAGDRALNHQGNATFAAPLPIPEDATGLTYELRVADGSTDSSDASRGGSISVADDIAPVLEQVEATAPTTGDDLTFTVNATDNVGVDDVTADVTFQLVDGTGSHTIPLTGSSGTYQGTLSIPSNATEIDYTVKASDDAGSETTHTVTGLNVVDDDAPHVSIESITDTVGGSTFLSGEAMVDLAASDNIGTDTITLTVGNVTVNASQDGTSTWSANLPTEGLMDGAHELQVQATDAAGNHASATTEVTVDNTGPTTTLQAPNAWVTETPVTATTTTDDTSPGGFAGSGVDATWTCVGTCDDASDFTENGSVSLSNEGTYNVAAYSVDNAGNVGPTDSVTVRIDTVAPDVTLQSPIEVATGSTILLNATISDTTSGLNETDAQVTYAFGDDEPTTTPLEGTGDGSFGVHVDVPRNRTDPLTYTLQAQDAAGNLQEASATVTVVDATDPVLSNLTLDDGSTGDDVLVGTTHLSVEADDEVALDTVQVHAGGSHLGDATLSDGTWSFTFNSDDLPDGDTELRIVAEDGSGNTANLSRTLTVDNTAPTLTLVNATSEVVEGSNASVTVNVTDLVGIQAATLLVDGTTHETVDLNGTTSTALTFQASIVDLGNHNLTVRATDTVGNAHATDQGLEHTVEAVPGPVTTLSLAPADATREAGSNESVTFSVEAQDTRGNDVSLDLQTDLSWSLSSEEAGTLDAHVLHPGTTAGTYAVTAQLSSDPSVEDSASVTLTPGVLSVIRSDHSSLELLHGSTHTLVVHPEDVHGNDVDADLTWSSSQPDIVDVDPSTGTLEALQEGTATITVTNTTTGINTSVEVDVVLEPGQLESIRIQPADATMTAGSLLPLSVEGVKSNGETLAGIDASITTENDTVILEDDVLRAFNTGTVEVTATFGALTTHADVTVNPGALSDLRLQPTSATVAPGDMVEFTGHGRDAHHNIVHTANATWSLVSEGTNHTVTPNGTFVAGSDAGAFEVQATSGGVTASATVHVTDVEVTRNTTTVLNSTSRTSTDGNVSVTSHSVGVAKVENGSEVRVRMDENATGNTSDADIEEGTVKVARNASRMALDIERWNGSLDVAPEEVNLADLHEVVGADGNGKPPALYLHVTASEDGVELSSEALNDLVEGMEVRVRVPATYFDTHDLDPTNVSILEYTEGTRGTTFDATLVGGTDGELIRYDVAIDSFSSFAILSDANPETDTDEDDGSTGSDDGTSTDDGSTGSDDGTSTDDGSDDTSSEVPTSFQRAFIVETSKDGVLELRAPTLPSATDDFVHLSNPRTSSILQELRYRAGPRLGDVTTRVTVHATHPTLTDPAGYDAAGYVHVTASPEDLQGNLRNPEVTLQVPGTSGDENAGSTLSPWTVLRATNAGVWVPQGISGTSQFEVPAEPGSHLVLARDIQPPTVEVEDPDVEATDDTEAPTLRFRVSDNRGILWSSTQTDIDGSPVNLLQNLAAGTLTYDAGTDLAPGEHTLTLRVVDASGLVTEETVTFTHEQQATDTAVAPTLLRMENGSLLTYTVEALVPVDQVTFEVDGTHVGTVDAPPFRTIVDRTLYPTGHHDLTVTVYPASGDPVTTNATFEVRRGVVEDDGRDLPVPGFATWTLTVALLGAAWVLRRRD